MRYAHRVRMRAYAPELLTCIRRYAFPEWGAHRYRRGARSFYPVVHLEFLHIPPFLQPAYEQDQSYRARLQSVRQYGTLLLQFPDVDGNSAVMQRHTDDPRGYAP